MCFLSQPLKCFTLSSGAGESATSGKNLNDLSHTGPARPKPRFVESSAANRVDNLVLVKFGFSALSVPRFFGA